MAKLKPVGDIVLVIPQAAEKKSPGGIVMPDVVNKRPTLGVVAAVGPGRRLESGGRNELQVYKGALVSFKTYTGTEMEIEGQNYVALTEADIIAIIE